MLILLAFGVVCFTFGFAVAAFFASSTLAERAEASELMRRDRDAAREAAREKDVRLLRLATPRSWLVEGAREAARETARIRAAARAVRAKDATP